MYLIVFILVLSHPCNLPINWASSSSVPAVEYGELKLFQAAAAYEVESEVLLADDVANRTDIGYRITASLIVEPAWSAPDSHHEFLLKFHLQSPKLFLRGNRANAEFLPHKSIWDSHADSTFYAYWRNGIINNTFLDPNEAPDILNFKKSLISLFQFQALDGEHIESDISGQCDVLYETISMTSFRKIKRKCSVEETPEEREADVAAQEEEEVERGAQYWLSAALDALHDVRAHEARRLGPRGAALRLRAALHLRRAAPPAPSAPTAPTAPPALAATLQRLPPALAPLSLAPHFTDDPTADDTPLEQAVEEAREALATDEAGAGGTAAEAEAAARLLHAVRAAPAPALAALLRRDRLHALRPALCRLLGLAGTAAAHAAADGFLHLAAADPLQPLARHYLAAAALAERPQPARVAALLRLGEEARDAAVAAAALLAAAAAAPRAGPRAGRAVRDSLLRSLARCKEDECRAVRLRALGNLRRADGAEALLEHAERGRRGAALAALHALDAAPPAALAAPARRRRLLALVCSGGRALDVRGAALDLLLRRSPPAALREVLAGVSGGAAPAELRRLLWQRVRQLAADDAGVAAAVRALPPHLTAWHAQAQPGTSSVLTRSTGWTALGWRARLDSVQLAAAGLLRAGRVRLLADDGAGVAEQLSVELWTRGLESLAGAAEGAAAELDEGDEGAEAAAGGLELGVGGVRLAGVRLFDGQAELLAHVWAGAGSEPTPALRALLPLRTRAGRAALLAGAALHYRRAAAAALALDAHAQVSLWSRGARAALELRAGGAGGVRAALGAAPGAPALRAHAAWRAEPRLLLAADLDFYDKVALCVRAHLPDFQYAHNVTLRWAAGGASGAAARRWARPAPGRTLSLGAANDATCRALVAADDR
ncbi:microsomal triacylglycerol transfer protein [Galleria mellonella]|uniref:Microsomal triacylglycerol transfer protein n=1 Tax=Galleria mellonella TaxID=7137 RepID=A0ABM3MIC0_GALME|nr:microsomal triacylglycerol transfer protein [Galleria mellonella]